MSNLDMPEMIQTVTATEARRNLSRLLDEVSKGAIFLIQRRGKPMAVIVPIALYERWQQALKTDEQRRKAD